MTTNRFSTELQAPFGFSLSAAAYQRPESDYAKVSEGWRPFRMWAAIILVRNLAREGGWAAVPEDFARRRRRSAMSSAVAR